MCSLLEAVIIYAILCENCLVSTWSNVNFHAGKLWERFSKKSQQHLPKSMCKSVNRWLINAERWQVSRRLRLTTRFNFYAVDLGSLIHHQNSGTTKDGRSWKCWVEIQIQSNFNSFYRIRQINIIFGTGRIVEIEFGQVAVFRLHHFTIVWIPSTTLFEKAKLTFIANKLKYI